MQTEHEAKEFFVAAILAQASREGLALSENEQWMLRFSESDPLFVVDADRLREFESETASPAYEAKVAGLVRRAYEHDIQLNSEARRVFREARKCLGRGDHYVLVMIDAALGAPRRALPRPLRFGLLAISIPAALLALLIAVGLAHIALGNEARSSGDTLPFAAGSALFALMTVYLVRLILREARA